MEEHTIRLRGGWECFRPNEPTTHPSTIALPTPSATLPPGRLILRRRFGRPPSQPSAPAILWISGMPGLRSLTFNGRPIEAGSPDGPDFRADLGPLQPRNELTIEADAPALASDWGDVRLVFAEPSASEPPSA